MLIVIGCAVLGILFGIWAGYEESDFAVGFMGAFIAIIALAFVGFLTAVGIGSFKHGHGIEIRKHPLIALEQSPSRKEFFLALQTFGDGPQYMYYEKTRDGSVWVKLIPANTVRVYEEERTNGLMVTRKEKDGWGRFSYSLENGPMQYEFHVPKGSIERGFTLDAKQYQT